MEIDLQALALLGAEKRLSEIARMRDECDIEAARLEAFLKREESTLSKRGTNGSTTHTAASTEPRKRGRRQMSAAERKAVGDRMRKYWAARREEQENKKRNASRTRRKTASTVQ